MPFEFILSLLESVFNYGNVAAGNERNTQRMEEARADFRADVQNRMDQYAESSPGFGPIRLGGEVFYPGGGPEYRAGSPSVTTFDAADGGVGTASASRDIEVVPDNILDLDELFNSAGTFADNAPEFQPIDPMMVSESDEIRVDFDPSDLYEVGENIRNELQAGVDNIAANLSAGGPDFSGLRADIESRFTDPEAFEAERLGALARSGRTNLERGRQRLIGLHGGNRREAAADLAGFEFNQATQQAQGSNEIKRAAEEIRNQNARDIGAFDIQAELAESADQRARDMLAAEIGTRGDTLTADILRDLGISGEGMELQADIATAGNVGSALQSDQAADIAAQRDNFLIPFNAALAEAGLDFQDANAQLGHLMQIYGIEEGAAQFAASLGMSADQLWAQMLLGHQETIPQLGISSSLAALRGNDYDDGGMGFGISTPIGGFNFQT